MVTGAGSGIGRRAALGLAADGFSLTLVGRRTEPLEETAEMARAHGVTTLPVGCDVSDPIAVDALFTAVEERFGRLDFLFNNAGRLSGPISFDETPWELWRETIGTNLTGVYLCTRAAFKLMKHQDPRGGRIINNGSIAAQVPRPGIAAYTASKHGVTGLTKQAALEGRDYDICVGQIDVGNVRTRDGLGEDWMDVDNITETVRYLAKLPLEANVMWLTVHARTMPYIGRG